MNLDLGPAIYGGVRAMQDADRADREEEAHRTDQAIRTRRLKQEEELFPIRRRAAELELGEAEHAITRRRAIEADEATLRKLGIDRAKLSLEQQQRAEQLLQEARRKQTRLHAGLSNNLVSNDPQDIADALSDILLGDPGGEAGDRFTATRNPDGSITLNGPKNQPKTFVKEKVGGQDRSPEDQLRALAYTALDPLEAQKQRLAADLGIEKEGVKADAALQREKVKLEGRVTAAEAKALKEKQKRVDAGVRRISVEVDRIMKTGSLPGHFQSVYTNDDDAQLRPLVGEAAAAIYKKGADDDDDNMTEQRAANEGLTLIRQRFYPVKKMAVDSAKKLAAKKINPTDKAAVDAAAEKGDADAVALKRALDAAKLINPGLDTYLLGQLPTK